MEKYGVEEVIDQVPKTASEATGMCPICGSHLRPARTTGVLLCPKCGSRPFEERDGTK